MSRIQRALTLASLVLVTFLSAVTDTTQRVTLNDNEVAPGEITSVYTGDVIGVRNDACESMTVTVGAGKRVDIQPGHGDQFLIQESRVDPLEIHGMHGDTWTFELDAGTPGRR